MVLLTLADAIESEAGWVGIEDIVAERRLRIGDENLHFRKREIAVHVLVDVEVDDVIGLEPG